MPDRRTLAGRYELTAPLGGGAMGEVFSAYDKRLDRPVAVKLMRSDITPTVTDGVRSVDRFAREARLTARVEHPGVPAVFDAGEEDGRLYLVMQLVEGTDLVNLLGQCGPLPVDWAVAVAAQVATILAAAHAVSLVHRDLKPSNIMVKPDGTIVVLDFGVAALLEPGAPRLTRTGEAIGSPAYMASEQVLGGLPTPRTDLYALGCILHEMLTGRRLFTADSTFALMRQQVEEPPLPVRSLRADVPAALERLVLQMLAKQPEDRPADAHEVHERLRPFLPVPGGDEPADNSDPTLPFRHPLAPRRRAERRPVEAKPAPAAPAAPAPDFDQVRDEAADLAMRGRFTQAAELLSSLLAALPPDRRRKDVRGARLQLANTLLLGGDYARALVEYERLVADVGPERTEDDDDILHWKVQIATCHAALGHSEDALAYLEPVLAMRRRQLGNTHDDVVELRRQAALLRAVTGNVRQAVADVRALLADLGSSDARSADLREFLSRVTEGTSDT